MNDNPSTSTSLTPFQRRMLVLNYLLQHPDTAKSELMTQTGLTADIIDDCLNDIYEYYPFERTQGRYARIRLLVNNYSTPPLNVKDLETLTTILEHYPLPREFGRDLSAIVWKLQRHLAPTKTMPKAAAEAASSSDLQNRIFTATQQILANLLKLPSASLADLSHLSNALEQTDGMGNPIEELLLKGVQPLFPCSECHAHYGDCPMDEGDVYLCTERFISFFEQG